VGTVSLQLLLFALHLGTTCAVGKFLCYTFLALPYRKYWVLGVERTLRLVKLDKIGIIRTC
jgi:hypothetical protein